ncbi:MAG: PAS domain-containing sensor histidine kinase, partial [Promethearchaeota archaeon]
MSDETLRKKAGDLEQAYSEFNQMFNASLPLRIINKDSEIIRVNNTYTNLFNLSEEEVLGRKCYDPDLGYLGHQCNTDLCSMNQIEQGKEHVEYELTTNFDDNTKIVNLVRSVPYRNLNGEFVGIIQNFTDITKRSEFEGALKESEEKYRILFNEAPFGIVLFRSDGTILDSNTATERISGFQKAELIGKNYKEIGLYYDPTDASIEKRQSLLSQGKDLGVREIQLYKKNGELYWASSNVSLIQLGKEIVVQAIIQDITKRKEAEEKLKESEEKYRSLVEDSLEGIWVIDDQANTSFVNQSMAKMFGYTIEEMIGVNLYEFMDEEGKKLAETNFERRRQGIKEDHEFEFLHKSGQKVFTTMRTNPIYDENGVFNGAMAFVTDVTDQKLVQEKIEDMARFPLENPNPILRLNKNYVLLANSASQDLFGIAEGNKIPKILMESVTQAFSQENHVEMDLEIADKIYNLFIIPIKGKDYANIYGMDITEQKLAQEKITDMARFPLENPNPILRLSRNYILLANSSSQKLFDVGEGSKIPKILKESVNQAFTQDGYVELELEIGDRIYNLFIVPIQGKEYANIYGMDITARKEAEEKLGRFVSTVSHELRTPVSVLTMSMELLESHSDKITPEVTEKLRDGISRNIFLLRDLIEDILTLSRIDEGKTRLEWKEYRPSIIINDILTLMEPIGNEKNITFKLDVGEKINLFGDSKKIDQVFRIFIDNAIKYSKDSNIVRIKAMDHYVGEYNPKNKDGVLIQFIDKGIGISEKEISSIFQRFFRSEQVTNIPGTGLGLSIAKELIELHSGEVFLESSFG